MGKNDIYKNLQSSISVEKFKEKEHKNSKKAAILQIMFASIICFSSITTMAFAKDISRKIYDNYFNTGSGVGSAIENGYIEKAVEEDTTSESTIENEFTGKKVSGVDTKIKVDEFIMDDFTLSVTFDVTLSDDISEVIEPKKVGDMNFPDLVIYDENDIILFSQYSKNEIEKFCIEKGLNKDDYDLDSDKIVNSGVNCYVKERNGNHIKMLYNIYTGGGDSYPKSKKLNFYLKDIRISENVEAMDGEEEVLLQGNWDFSVDVPEKMYNRKNVIYKQVSTTNKDFNVTTAVLYNTGMDIGLTFPTGKKPAEHPSIPELDFYYSLDEDDELKTIDILNYLTEKLFISEEYQKYMSEQLEVWKFDKYITTESGEEFGLTEGPRENGGASIDEDGIMHFEGMFDVTIYNASDKLVVHVDYKGKKADITLEKVGE